MAAPATRTDFLDLARRSGVIDDQTLSRYSQGTLPSDPKECADALVREKVLTEFQAKLLLGGQSRGLVLGAYRILQPLGQGGMGVVYLAEHALMKRGVALKVFRPARAQEELALERFYREARAAAALDHPNIVGLYDVCQAGGVHFLVMEYVNGVSLQYLMETTGPLHYTQAVRYITQAAAGLAHAHAKGFVHRDVKPANLMVDKNGLVKVLDMGLARSFVDPNDRLTVAGEAGSVIGTADYLCPEQGLSEPTDARSDIYSLGLTLFALIAGHPPYQGNTTHKLVHHQMTPTPDLTELNPGVPAGLNEVVQAMTAKRPKDRYQSAEEVIDALRTWTPHSASGIGSRTTRAVPRVAPPVASRGDGETKVMKGEVTLVGAVPPVNPTPGRWRKKRLAMAAAVLGLVAAAIVGLSGPRKSPAPAGADTAAVVPAPPPQSIQPPVPAETPPVVETPPSDPPPADPPPADPPRRREFVSLPLDRVATACSLEALFGDDGLDRFEMADWGPVTVNGIPFNLVDPRPDDRLVPNIILLHTPMAWTRPNANAVVTSMPRSVTLPVGSRAAGIHLLGCVSGWGWPYRPSGGPNQALFQKGSVAAIVRLRYADGETEDHGLRNGEQLADYVKQIEVPGSTFAFLTRNGRQVRYTTVLPTRNAVVKELELVKGENDGTAPIFFAVTLERPLAAVPKNPTPPVRSGVVVFSAADVRPGLVELRNPQRTSQVAPGMFPGTWHVHAFKAGIAGEVEVADEDGARAVILRNLPEATAVGTELSTTSPVHEVAASTRCVVRLTYKANGPTKAWFEARSSRSARDKITRVNLHKTDGWEVAEIEFTSDTDHPLFLNVSNDDRSGRSRVFIRSIEVTTPDRPGGN
jgi:serine/threonine protein kinase